MKIYIDADACPVKDEVYKVAKRHGLTVLVVSNRRMKVPFDEKVQLVVVGDAFDEADDWIAERIEEGDITITTDLLLAEKCIHRGGFVLTPKGVEHDEATISSALATREILDTLRQMGEMTGGPAPMQKMDKSNFLSELHQMVERVKRVYGEGAL